jgi:hypothetical protein
MRRAAALSVSGLLAIAAAGFAAQAPLEAPVSTGALRALTSAGVVFPLPHRFTPSRSVSANRIEHGVFEHRVDVSQALTCLVVLSARGRLQRSRPEVSGAARYWGGDAFKITERGRRGPLRWYVGRSGSFRAAFAWEPAPNQLSSSRLRYVAFWMTLGSKVAEAADECAPSVSAELPTLRSAIRNVRTNGKR